MILSIKEAMRLGADEYIPEKHLDEDTRSLRSWRSPGIRLNKA